METYDGIMIEGDQGWPKKVREKIVCASQEKGIPVASLNYPLAGCTYVGTDNYGAIHAITKHLIHKLDLHMVEQICQTHDKVGKNKLPLIPVSCNLSRYDFSACDIFSEIEKIVEKYRIPRKSLHIEVTESTIISDPAFIYRELGKFHDAGYEIWMDDFGSGYSSFNVLKDFDFDVVKLDMSFLSNMNDKSKKIIASIIEMAESIGMRTLAEGVETEDQFAFLRSVGCDMAQGYLFSEPHRFDMEGWRRMCGQEL